MTVSSKQKMVSGPTTGRISPRIFVLLCLLLTVILPTFSLGAPQTRKVPQIGWLSLGSSSDKDARFTGFIQGLRDFGYVEGQNIVIERRYAEGKLDRLSGLAAELIRLKLDVIVTGGVPQLLAVKHATKSIPIVAGGAGDLVATGIVASLARPGGNITGLTSVSTDLPGKWLELLKETLPSFSRVGAIWNPADKGPAAILNELELAARGLGLQVQSLEVRESEDFEIAFRTVGGGRAAALVVLQSNLTNTHRKLIADLAKKNRLPTMFGEKGTKPAALPVEQPTKFEFVINLKTAKQIGLTIPPNILANADKVIK